MWQEVISNKEAHEDPVVYAPLKVKGERQAGHGQLSGQVLKTWREHTELTKLICLVGANNCSCTNSSLNSHNYVWKKNYNDHLLEFNENQTV